MSPAVIAMTTSALAVPATATALELDLERKAQEGPDHHDDRQHPDAAKRRFDGDGADDVRRDEELEL